MRNDASFVLINAHETVTLQSPPTERARLGRRPERAGGPPACIRAVLATTLNEMGRPQRACAAAASLAWTADARPPSVQPAAPVGSRIRVFWQADQAWYSGTIKAYTEAVDTHLVVYDDGDQRNEALGEPSLEWELLLEPPSPAPRDKPTAKPPAPKPPAPMPPKPKLKPKPKAKAAQGEPLPSPKPGEAKGCRPPPKKPRVEREARPGAAAASAAAAAAATAAASPPQLWPGGGTWMPSTADWGTRTQHAYGCGKCRWQPSGCRGCIAAAASFVPAAVPPLPRGEVALPLFKTHKHVYAHTQGPGEAARRASLKELTSRVRVQAGAAQSDPTGHGVVAVTTLRRGASRTLAPAACCFPLSVRLPSQRATPTSAAPAPPGETSRYPLSPPPPPRRDLARLVGLLRGAPRRVRPSAPAPVPRARVRALRLLPATRARARPLQPHLLRQRGEGALGGGALGGGRRRRAAAGRAAGRAATAAAQRGVQGGAAARWRDRARLALPRGAAPPRHAHTPLAMPHAFTLPHAPTLPHALTVLQPLLRDTPLSYWPTRCSTPPRSAAQDVEPGEELLARYDQRVQ